LRENLVRFNEVTVEDRTWTLHRKRVGKKRYQNNERNRHKSLERKKERFYG
jgi:hypothetical protein